MDLNGQEIELHRPNRVVRVLEDLGIRPVAPRDITREPQRLLAQCPELVGDRQSMDPIPWKEIYYRRWWTSYVN